MNPIRNTFGGVVKQTALSKFYDLTFLDRFVAFVRALILGEPVQVADRPVSMTPSGRLMPIIAGGDGTDDVLDPELAAKLEGLAEVSDEDLPALLTELREAATAVSEEDTDAAIEALTIIATHVESVTNEIQFREAAAAERETKRQEVLAKINGPAEEEETEAKAEEETEAKAETEETETSETEAETAPVAETTETETETTEEKEAVTASTTPKRPSPGAIAKRAPKPRKSTAQGALIAAGDVPGHSAGQKITDLRALGEAFQRKVEAMSGSRGSAVIASLDVRDLFPDDRKLTGDADANAEKIAKVTSLEAIVAAGGVCAPVDARYDVANVSSAARPLRDALARFQARRGGVRFVAPPTLADVTGAVGLWTELNDRAPGTNQGNAVEERVATKPILTIDCGDEETVYVDAITARATIGNFARRFAPERFNSFWELIQAYHARVAENRIWNRMTAESTAVTAAQTLGTSRDVLAGLDRAAAAFRSRHRMSENSPLAFFAPLWLKDQIRADLARQMPGDNTLAVAEAEINRFFNVRNINVTWSLDADQVFDAQSVATLDRWPDTVETILTHEGAFGHLDGGTLDLGTEIRDPSLNETNDVEAFMESFEGVAFWGVQSLAITFDTCPSGEVSGTTDITPAICAAGS